MEYSKVGLDRKNISRNVIVVVAQVIVSGGVLFILYRYLFFHLGVEQIGVWSLVTSLTSISRIGDFGLSAGVVRFVAQAFGQRDTRRAADVVQTVALTLGTLIGAFLIIGYPLFTLALRYFLPAPGVPIALNILPISLISLWVMMIVSVFSGGLDGCLRMDLRSLLMGLSHVVYLGLAILLVPSFGLKGVIVAQLIQSVGLMLVLWHLLRKQLQELPLLPLRWSFSLLKEMFNYGMNYQTISILNMLFDPMVKTLMSKFGGLDALGYYGMANTFILQGRAVIVEASRVMVPSVASLPEHDSARATQLFIDSYRITFYISVLFFGLLGISITVISMLWLGFHQETFIQFTLLLNLGWFVNTLSGPAYFSNLGSGKLGNNVIGQAIVSLGGFLLGATLGLNYHGIGVVVGIIFGLITGSLYTLISHTKRSGLNWITFIVPRNMAVLLILVIVISFFSNFGVDPHSSFFMVIGVAFLCSVSFMLLAWFNPARMMIKNFIKNKEMDLS